MEGFDACQQERECHQISEHCRQSPGAEGDRRLQALGGESDGEVADEHYSPIWYFRRSERR
jgi:hypothetical protein